MTDEPRISRRVPIWMVALVVAATTPSAPAASQASDIAVQRLSNRPQAYYGRPVTLRGVVGRVYEPQIFSLDDGSAGPGVLVLLPGEPDGSVAEGLEVIVTGTAREFADAFVYRELGSLDATPELVATLSRAPVVVARTATRVDGTTLLVSTGTDATSGTTSSDATNAGTGNDVVHGPTGSALTRGPAASDVTRGPTFTSSTRGTTGTDATRGATGTDTTSGPTTRSLGMPGPARQLSASPDRIAGSPESYVGQRVVLTGDVSGVESEGLFALAPGVGVPGALLVLNPRPWSPPAAGARVTVSGTVRPFGREDLGPIDRLPANAEALEARYAGRPVVVADSIRTSEGRELVAPSSLR